MNSYDLEVAFKIRLDFLTFTGGRTVDPDEVFDPAKAGGASMIRRAWLKVDGEDFAGFGNGRFSRVTGHYQIDIWVLRSAASGLKTLKNQSDAHLAHFYPANGRGLTLTKNSTSAHILKRPSQTYLGREGVYLREVVDVEFYVEIPAVG